MQVNVKGRNLEITPALRQYAEKRTSKLARLLETGRGQEPVVDVVLRLEGELRVAEATVQLGGLIVRGEARTTDMYGSIDAATDKLLRQVKTFKGRLQARWEETPKTAVVARRLAGEGDQEGNKELAQEDQVPRVVRTKRFAFKPMTVDEAVLQMELLGHDFFVFSNAETQEVNVVYRRKDGNYGLIEPGS